MFRDTASMNKHLQRHGPRKISIGKYFYLLHFCLYIYKVYMFVINVKNHLLKVQNYVVINLYTLVKKHFNVHLKDVEKVFHLILIYGHMFEFIQVTNHTFVHLMVVVVDLPNQQISNNIFLHMQKFVDINHLLFQPLLLLLQKFKLSIKYIQWNTYLCSFFFFLFLFLFLFLYMNYINLSLVSLYVNVCMYLCCFGIEMLTWSTSQSIKLMTIYIIFF